MTPREYLKKRDEETEKEKVKQAINSKLKHIGHLAGRKNDLKDLQDLDSSLSGMCDFYSESSEEKLFEITAKKI